MNLAERPVVDFLRSVFNDEEEIPSPVLPQFKEPEGCVIRGEVRSSKARQIIALVKMVGEEIEQLEISGSDPDGYGIRLRALINILQALFWQLVIEECPMTAFHHVALTADWHFYDTAGWFEIDLPANLQERSFFHFMESFSAVLSGKRQYLREPSTFKERELGEQTLVTIADESLQGLLCLAYEFRSEISTLKSEVIKLLSKQEEILISKRMFTVLTMRSNIARLIDAMEAFFSLAISDICSEKQLAPPVSILIRKGWRVVANIRPETN